MLTHVPAAKDIVKFREMLGLYHYQPAVNPKKVVTEVINKTTAENAVKIATMAGLIAQGQCCQAGSSQYVSSMSSSSTGIVVKAFYHCGASKSADPCSLRKGNPAC